MSDNIPKNTDENGRDHKGRFTTGNNGKPKGASHKTTKELREFITGFLNDKSTEIPDMWDNLDDKDKLSLFMHLCRLVMPKPNEEPIHPNNFTPIEIKFDFDEERIQPKITPEQIDKLIDKL